MSELTHANRSKVKACELQRRSRRFPAGLLDQPFYGWVPPAKEFLEPASAGFLKASAISCFAQSALKLMESTLKRAPLLIA
jgi:hypothetical protein